MKAADTIMGMTSRGRSEDTCPAKSGSRGAVGIQTGWIELNKTEKNFLKSELEVVDGFDVVGTWKSLQVNNKINVVFQCHGRQTVVGRCQSPENIP